MFRFYMCKGFESLELDVLWTWACNNVQLKEITLLTRIKNQQFGVCIFSIPKLDSKCGTVCRGFSILTQNNCIPFKMATCHVHIQ
jgi:hypothetical protein